jgi:hypothetical protein
MKSIIFTACALIFFAIGAWLFEYIVDRIPDDKWSIVVIEIIIAFLALIIYIIIVISLAKVFNLTWSYPSI